MNEKLDQEIRAGMNANRLMEDPVFKEAFSVIESTLIERIRQVPMGDTKTQHELVLSIQLLGQLKNYFRTVADTGKMAKIQKDTILDRAKRLMRNTNG